MRLSTAVHSSSFGMTLGWKASQVTPVSSQVSSTVDPGTPMRAKVTTGMTLLGDLDR
ncbi:hypothetical protein [uncultured Cutibacterium sp.]|uniref:hypothetical protein n=1 Tax=Cutibacterium granulosum TaxID=33011 RepID=UPI0035A6DF42